MAFKERVFSGVQPTGNLHLGNYLGAITKFVALQDRYDCIYCVVDLHAITVWQDPSELPRATREVTAAFLACGIDPKKHIIFNQSQVAEHAELAWVFNCVARVGWLNRMTQFKEKAGKDRENASVGLYVYPNLMAADILVYRATHVPVGEDQKQHLELSRDIAQKFNNDFARLDPRAWLRRGLLPATGAADPGAGDPGDVAARRLEENVEIGASDYSRINLTDDADAIAQKIRKAKTDPEPLPSEEKGLAPRPEADNLVGIYAALQGMSKAEVLGQFGGGQFSTFKTALVDLAVAKLGPIGAEMKKLVQDPVYIDSRAGRRFAARAGDRRRNHEGGQGYRRLRAALVAARDTRLVWPAAAMPPLSACACISAHMTEPERGDHEQQAPQLRKGAQAQISRRHRRHRRNATAQSIGRPSAPARTKSQIVMLRVIEPGDRNQQWLGVADLMKAEAQEAAKTPLDKFRRAREEDRRH